MFSIFRFFSCYRYIYTCILNNFKRKSLNVSCLFIYWTPKETLQSSLLYYFIKWDNMAFLHLVKVVRCFWGQMPNWNPVQWSDTFVGRFERFARPARYLYFRVLWRWTSTVDREYSKTKKNHPKLIIKRKRKAPYQLQPVEWESVTYRRIRPSSCPLTQ